MIGRGLTLNVSNLLFVVDISLFPNRLLLIELN